MRKRTDRVIVDLDSQTKKKLYEALNGRTLKSWFLEQVDLLLDQDSILERLEELEERVSELEEELEESTSRRGLRRTRFS